MSSKSIKKFKPSLKSYLAADEDDTTTYMLETQEFITNKNGITKGFAHVGYMKAIFNFEDEASSYYDTYNPHMRSLNAHKTMCSDWDPKTMLRYIVRIYHGEILTLSPFNPEHEPLVTKYPGGGSCTQYLTSFPKEAYEQLRIKQ